MREAQKCSDFIRQSSTASARISDMLSNTASARISDMLANTASARISDMLANTASARISDMLTNTASARLSDMLANTVTAQLSNITSQFDDIRKSMALPDLLTANSNATDLVRQLVITSDLFKNFPRENIGNHQQIFSARVFSETYDFDENEDTPISEKSFDDVCNMVIAHIEQLPKTRVSYEGSIGILLAILSILYTLYSDIQQSDEISEIQISTQTHQKSIDKVLSEIEKIKPEADSEVGKTFYIVLKTVHLRLMRTTKSKIIAVLYPNQLVELHKTKGKWIYIEYFDQLSGVIVKCGVWSHDQAAFL